MYETIEIRSMQEIRDLFPNGVADRNNWLMCSTSGPHGSSDTIDECEYILRGEVRDKAPLSNGKTIITVLMVKPRECILGWGEIQVNMEDLNYLRKIVRSTLQWIEKSQGGNI